jgi:hypothetical protein
MDVSEENVRCEMNPQKASVAIPVAVNRALFALLVFTGGAASAQAPTVIFISPWA